MKLSTKLKIAKARRQAEAELGVKLPNDFARDVLKYCERKLICIKKDEDYLPLLYRCELPQHAQMRAITEYSIAMMKQRKEAEKSVRDLQTDAVPSPLS